MHYVTYILFHKFRSKLSPFFNKTFQGKKIDSVLFKPLWVDTRSTPIGCTFAR